MKSKQQTKNREKDTLIPSYKLDAQVTKSPVNLGIFRIMGQGKLKCGNCGNDTFRVVIDYSLKPHFYCSKCGCEHIIYIEEDEGFDDE